MANKKITIAVVIVNFNSTKDTITLLHSLSTNHGLVFRFKIFVVDNGTHEKDFQLLQTFLKNEVPLPSVLIRNKANIGLSQALNQVIPKVYASDFIWRLDNDVTVKKTTLSHLLKTMNENADCGCVGSVAYGYENHNQVLGGGWDVNLWKGSVTPIFPTPQRSRACDFVSGFSQLFRTSDIKKIGYLSDSNFFAYVEDADICLQMKRIKKNIYVNPKSIVYHRIVLAKNLKPFLIYLSTRNRFFLMRKNSRAIQYLIFSMYFFIIATSFNLKNIWLSGGTLTQKAALAISFFKAIFDGYILPLEYPSKKPHPQSTHLYSTRI